jgi:hypothetical protein
MKRTGRENNQKNKEWKRFDILPALNQYFVIVRFRSPRGFPRQNVYKAE